MTFVYEVVIAGGSISGLLCAREIAARGHKVLVIEEDYEIGTPEHCGGLVSTKGLEQLGVIPHRKTTGHQIESAEIFSPGRKKLVINSKKQNVLEINRRELDKQVAHQAQKNGAEIWVKTSFLGFTKDGVKTSEGEIKTKILVDARGVSSLIHRDRTGVISSAQYEILADWITRGRVEVYFDSKKYPGFFAWVIPSADGKGKVGVAGRAINTSEVLSNFLDSRGNYSTIRKIFAPIWINGPLDDFVKDNVVIVGDAAGQSKPTTAGGIFSCGMGGIFAGEAISNFLKSGKRADLEKYQKNWTKKFGKEFEKQRVARKMLEKINNEAIDKLFELITPQVLDKISEKDDFDFHTSTLVNLFGVKGTLKAAKALLGGEIKNLLAQ